MDIKTYCAHAARFLTITDGPKESTILQAENETMAQTLERYLRDERNTIRAVQARIDFYTQARGMVS